MVDKTEFETFCQTGCEHDSEFEQARQKIIDLDDLHHDRSGEIKAIDLGRDLTLKEIEKAFKDWSKRTGLNQLELFFMSNEWTEMKE